MARVRRPLPAAVRVASLLLIGSCALPAYCQTTSAGACTASAGDRILAPAGQIQNPAESIISPDTANLATRPPPAQSSGDEPISFTLSDAISFALQNSPRLRSARADVQRASGDTQVSFAPFLPQVDLLSQYGVVSSTLAPGTPGPEGFILASGDGTRTYTETELGLQWTLFDFGRTGGRYGQAMARERVAELRFVRAQQTVEFDVAAAYFDVLLAGASRRVQEDAVRRAEAILEDTKARRKGGVGLREDVLRAEVQVSESREELVLAREREFNSLARLNNIMGRNASLPLQVIDVDHQPPLPGMLTDLLAQAASERPEVRLAQQSVAAAEEGRRAAKGEFMPQIFVRGSAGRTDGENVVSGWQEGAGLHLDAPLYAGGRYRGGLRAADADVGVAVAQAQEILDAIGLEVNLAYRGVMASHERIDLSQTAVAQSQENLRIQTVSYRNGNATPTDIVDGEAALTRAQQRFYSSTYMYLVALARVDYATGQRRQALPTTTDAKNPEELPVQLPPQDGHNGAEQKPAPNRLPEVNFAPAKTGNDH